MSQTVKVRVVSSIDWNIPGQLGNTGQIVLNTCDQGECDCSEILENQKESRTTDKAKKASKVSGAAAATTTTTTSKPSRELRRPPRLVRQRPAAASAAKTDVSVTSSSSTSTKTSSASEESAASITRARLTAPRSRFFRNRAWGCCSCHFLSMNLKFRL